MSGRGRAAARWLAAALLAASIVPAGPVAAQEAELELVTSPIEGPVAGWPEAPDVDAVAWILLDATTGQVLAAERADEQRPVASTIKVLTALTAVRRAALDEEVTAGEEVVGVPGASVSLAPGDRWTVEELLQGILIRSGNDAAEALAAHVAGDAEAYLELMREDAVGLGLDVDGEDGVVLRSVSGLDDVNQLSAADLAVLGRAALAEPQLRELLAVETVQLPGLDEEPNRNLLLGSYPGATGIKTGFTTPAGNTLVASAARDGRELVAVVLDAGDDPARFEQAARLLDHGFDEHEHVEAADERVLLVAGGQRRLGVGPARVTVPAGAQVAVALGVPPRASDVAAQAPLLVDDAPVGELPVRLGPPERTEVDGAGVVGRAAVDGVHAALRAGLADGASGPAAGSR